MAALGPGATPREGEELKGRILEFWNSRVAKEGKEGGGLGWGRKGGWLGRKGGGRGWCE